MINLTDDSIAPGIVTKERGRMDIVNGLVMKFDKSIKLTRYHSTCSEDCCRSFEDMMAKGHMKECCRCTCSAHTACIVAGAMKNGIFGAMEMLVSKHQWGVARVDYCCEQSHHMGHLDCSASSAFAIDMLNHGLFNGPTGTNPRMPSGPGLSRGWMATSDGGHQKWRNEAVYVQLVVRSNSGNGQRWRRLIDKVYSGEDQKGVRELSAWVGEGFIYHVCTGIVCQVSLMRPVGCTFGTFPSSSCLRRALRWKSRCRLSVLLQYRGLIIQVGHVVSLTGKVWS